MNLALSSLAGPQQHAPLHAIVWYRWTGLVIKSPHLTCYVGVHATVRNFAVFHYSWAACTPNVHKRNDDERCSFHPLRMDLVPAEILIDEIVGGSGSSAHLMWCISLGLIEKKVSYLVSIHFSRWYVHQVVGCASYEIYFKINVFMYILFFAWVRPTLVSLLNSGDIHDVQLTNLTSIYVPCDCTKLSEPRRIWQAIRKYTFKTRISFFFCCLFY